MNTSTCVLRRVFLALPVVLLAACGGGGGGGSVAGGGGTSEPVVSAGVITGFGSVIVNGVRFDTASASFTVDDNPGGQDDLAVGDVVTIRGRINDDGRTGTATTVVGSDAVEGPVGSIDLAAGTLVVAGQEVITDADTSFDDNIPGASLAGLAVGQFVEVAGFFDAGGAIRATRIERKAAGGVAEVHGTVSALQPGVSFALNGLTVDYTGAAVDDCTGGQLADGLRVEVKGTTFSGGALVATRVECEGTASGGDAGASGDRREIEGLVTRFVSLTDFDVAGRPVTTTPTTVYDRGSAADVALNAKVEVEGTRDAAGVLVARKVSIRRASYVRITATVDALDASARTLTVLGITVAVDSLTRLEDKSDADVGSFSFADLRVGDYVELRGAELPAGSGQVLASRLEREDPDDREVVQGPVTAVAQPDLEVFGVTVQTNGGTEFEDMSDLSVSAGTFFGLVQVGDLVKARGTEVADRVLVADEVEFEDD